MHTGQKNSTLVFSFSNTLDLFKLNWRKILTLTVIQCLGGYFVFMFYLFFTWMFFGEGGDSALYTLDNRIVWALSPALGATGINVYRIVQGVKLADKAKVKTYIIIQSLFFSVYLIFTVIQLSQNGYKI